MTHTVTVVSVGTGDPDLLNTKTVSAIRGTGCLVLRTARHPLTAWLEKENISFSSLDSFYDEAEDFDSLNTHICDYLLSLASASDVVYAVSDVSSDRTVRTLLSSGASDVSFRMIPGTC